MTRSVDILQNKQLRVVLRQSIPPLYVRLYTNNEKGIADILLQSFFFCSVVEASYSDDADLDGIDSGWNELIEKVTFSCSFFISRNCQILYVCTINYHVLYVCTINYRVLYVCKILSLCALNMELQILKGFDTEVTARF